MNKTDKEIAKKWVEALRNGGYKQGEGNLYNENTDTYCCLGVLGCEVYDPGTIRDLGNHAYLLDNDDALAENLNDLDERDDFIKSLPSFIKGHHIEEFFSHLNDGTSLTFLKIFSIKEKTLNYIRKLFKELDNSNQKYFSFEEIARIIELEFIEN